MFAVQPAGTCTIQCWTHSTCPECACVKCCGQNWRKPGGKPIFVCATVVVGDQNDRCGQSAEGILPAQDCTHNARSGPLSHTCPNVDNTQQHTSLQKVRGRETYGKGNLISLAMELRRLLVGDEETQRSMRTQSNTACKCNSLH